MRLTKRLRAIVDLCPALESWADIGCDHGRTSCALILEEKAKTVYAADISAPSLQKAVELSQTIGIADRVLPRLGSGFAPIREDCAEGAVLTGMGGQLILEIMEAEPEVMERLNVLVLSPQKYPERVRTYLLAHGWRITQEIMVEELGKYYPVMLAEKGTEDPYSQAELLTGRTVRCDEDYRKFLEYKVRFWNRVLEGLKDDLSRERAMFHLSVYSEGLKNKFVKNQNV